MPIGTKNFDDPTLLPGREKHAILSTPGVAGLQEPAVGLINWRKTQGGTTAVLLVGSDTISNCALPWDIVAGSVAGAAVPSAVAGDRRYFKELGIARLRDCAENDTTQATVTAATKGIRSCTTAGVRTALAARLPGAEVVRAEFRKRSFDYRLRATGAALGIIIIVIVAPKLYAARGASAGDAHKVIPTPAVRSAVVGYILGMILSLVVIGLSRDTTLLIGMTPGPAAMLPVLMVGMCALADLRAIFKVTRIDPAVVFSR